MYVRVANGNVALEEAADTRSFKVVSSGPADLDRVLRASGWGWADGEEAMISVESVRRAAEGLVPTDWAANFEKMLDYARGKGWLNAGGEAIRAHIERVAE